MLPKSHRRVNRHSRNRSLSRAILDALEPRVLLSGNTYSLSLLHSFTGSPDGANPFATIVSDSSGNLFSTVSAGGANGDGAIYEIPSGTTAPLLFYSFTGGTNGGAPNAGVVFDTDGDMFGTTSTGGADNDGTVWEVVAGDTVAQTLYSFTGGTDGATPAGNIVMDTKGDLIGTTVAGGSFNDGTVWAIPVGTTSALGLHQFSGGADGAISYSGVTLDANGDIFGVAFAGGAHRDGTVFEISTTGAYSVLHAFAGKTDGSKPAGQLVFDNNGNLWGTTSAGGANNDGTIFEISSAGTFSTVLAFSGAANGAEPIAGLVKDASGNLFGSTFIGGQRNDGTLFEIPAGTTQVDTLFSFSGGNGARPYSSLYVDDAGNLWGTTAVGGADNGGEIFALQPTATTQIVFHSGPADVTAGKTLSPITIDLEKSDNSINTSDNSFVTLSIFSGPDGGTLLGTVTLQASHGVVTFTGLHLPKTGQYTLVATDGSLASDPSSPFNVLPGAPAKLVFTVEPTATIAGEDIAAVAVAIEDSDGNIVTTDSSSTITLNLGKGPAGATLGGTTSVTVIDGTATFSDLFLTKASTNYSFSATEGNLRGSSSSFTISPDTSSAHLVLTSQPVGAVVGKNLAPNIAASVEDQFGNILTTNRDSISLSITGGPGNTLTGHAAVTAHNGVATFSNISVPLAGNYTLQISDPALVINTPVSFDQNIAQGTSRVAAPHVSASYIFGQSVSLSTALQSDAPSTVAFTGTVGIYDLSHTLITTATLTSKGSVSADLSGLAPGTYMYTVGYSGDANHTAATSNTFTVVVNPAPTQIKFSTTTGNLAFGEGTTLIAVVSAPKSPGHTPTGTVTFLDNGSPIGNPVSLVSGTATLDVSTPTVGKHVYSASYSGATDFAVSTSSSRTISVSLDKVGINLQSSAQSPIAANATFNLTATLTVISPGVGTPTGSVVFMDGKTPLGTVTLSGGMAALPGISLAATGKHSITAVYDGDPTDSPVNSHPLMLTID